MIHLECPGCAATFSVPAAHAGKTGKCPTCATQFTIPAADGDAEVSSPAGSGALSEPVEVQPCPGCQARIAVARSDLGTKVECPYCTTRFVAVSETERPVPTPSGDRTASARSGRRRDEDDDEFEGDDDRPRRRRLTEGDGQTQVGPMGVMLVVGGGLAIVWTIVMMFFGGGLTCGMCCLWPGLYCGPIWGVFAIIRGAAMTNGSDWRDAPPTVLHVLQILLILNLDVINMTLGIVGLVLSNHESTRDYYAGNTDRFDD